MRIAHSAYYLIGLCLLLAAGLTVVATPKPLAVNRMKNIQLAKLIPTQFGDWTAETELTPIMVNPEVEKELDKIYTQTLSRTYLDSQGDQLMLSIAYGGIQNSTMHAHRPEVCYLAQGFEVGKLTKTYVDTPVGRIPVMRLDAKQGTRNEPITYWIRVGDYITRGVVEQNLVQLSYGLTGRWRDGLLVRVSVISDNERHAYRLEQSFVSDMLQAVPGKDRSILIGKLAT